MVHCKPATMLEPESKVRFRETVEPGAPETDDRLSTACAHTEFAERRRKSNNSAWWRLNTGLVQVETWESFWRLVLPYQSRTQVNLPGYLVSPRHKLSEYRPAR